MSIECVYVWIFFLGGGGEGGRLVPENPAQMNFLGSKHRTKIHLPNLQFLAKISSNFKKFRQEFTRGNLILSFFSSKKLRFSKNEGPRYIHWAIRVGRVVDSISRKRTKKDGDFNNICGKDKKSIFRMISTSHHQELMSHHQHSPSQRCATGPRELGSPNVEIQTGCPFAEGSSRLITRELKFFGRVSSKRVET